MRKILLALLPLLFVLGALAQDGSKTLRKGQARNTYIYGKGMHDEDRSKLGPVGFASQSASSKPTSEAEHEHTAACGHDHGQKADGTRFVCGTVEANEITRRRSPQWRTESDFEQFIKTNAKKLPKTSPMFTKSGEVAAKYTIPVIVHVLYYRGQAIGEDHNITKEQVYSQFEVLNEDYRKKRNTRGFNVDKVGADALIEFVPALYDPQGNLLPEPGIHRIEAESVTDGEYTIASDNRYMEMNWTEWVKAQTSWTPNCYLNLWSVGLSGGLLGYASLPDTDLPGIGGLIDPTPDEYEGVMVDYRRFGSYEKAQTSSVAKDSKGRAATHEIGHYLGLRHTWGDAPTDALGQYQEGCEYDDFVEDTPNSKQPMYNNLPLYLCGEREMVENMMDYADDDIKNVFSVGQIERMHTVLEFSPRRKELATSTVASVTGDKTPVVQFSVVADTLKVYEIFSFETKVERFPGSYKWEFEGGTPATSTDRNPGVYFTTTGKKKISLTISNKFSSVTLNRYVEVENFEPCEPVFKSTLSTLVPLKFTQGFAEGYMTGHGDLYGIGKIANKFFMTANDKAQAISQIELDFNRFRPKENYNPNQTFNILIMNEDATGKPNQVLATQKVNVGEAYKAFQQNKPLVVKLDNPVRPNTTGYFIVVDLDYQYQLDVDNRTRGYTFELKAGISPINFAWEYGVIAEMIDYPWELKEFRWGAFSIPEVENGWEAYILMHLLPKFTSDTTVLVSPKLFAPTGVPQDSTFKVYAVNKPAGVKKLQWRVQRAESDSIILDQDTISLSYNTAGHYTVSLTYLNDANCLQRTSSANITVQGIRFSLSADNEKIYCITRAMTLYVNEEFSSSTDNVYTWTGPGVAPGTTGIEVSVNPQVTSTYTATTTDEVGIKVSRSITLTVIPPQPKAAFKILTSHVAIAKDTIDLYIADFGSFAAENLSENGATFIWSMVRMSDQREIGGAYDFEFKNFESPSQSLFEGGGLYQFQLIVKHSGCGWDQGIYDTTRMYINVKSVAEFGEIGFTANDQPMSIATSSKYSDLTGAYITYVNVNDNITLAAKSSEIKKITWRNSYDQKEDTTRTLTLKNVRDRQIFYVDVVRERTIQGQKVSLDESVTVAVLFTDDIGAASVGFYPSMDSVCVNQAVKFVNTSKNSVNFKWEFTGGEPAPDERLLDLAILWSPNRVFKTPGEYKAKLTITSIDGNELVEERTIFVGASVPKIEAKNANGLCRIVNDTLYAYDYWETRYDARLILTGNGFRDDGIRYEKFSYQWWLDASDWSEETQQAGRLRPFFIFAAEDGNDQKLRITAFGCTGDTIEKVYPVKVLPLLNVGNFKLQANDYVYQFGQFRTLATYQAESNKPLQLSLRTQAGALAAINVVWYESFNDGSFIELGRGSEIAVTPTKNSIYTVEFTDLIGQGYSYDLPVQVGLGYESLRLINYDLLLTKDNVIELPLDYGSELVLWVDGILDPVWREVKTKAVYDTLSSEFAVVLAPRAGVYEVSGKAGNRLVRTTITVKETERPVEPPVEPEDKTEVISLYPVPANDILNIESPYTGKAYIVDSQGRVVKIFELQEGSSTLSVTSLSSGVYKLLVQKAKGGRIINRSFIVVR